VLEMGNGFLLILMSAEEGFFIEAEYVFGCRGWERAGFFVVIFLFV